MFNVDKPKFIVPHKNIYLKLSNKWNQRKRRESLSKQNLENLEHKSELSKNSPNLANITDFKIVQIR